VVARLVAVGFGVAVALTVAEVAIRFLAPQPLQHIQLDDQLYFVNRPLARFTYAREHEYSNDVAYNAWGFRGPVPDPGAPTNVTRILLIGDSQTEGLQVRYEETYGAVLQRDLERRLPGRRFEVVNLAVSAYGTHQEVLTLRRYGARVRPCWVVLGFYPGNDLADNVRLPLVTEGANGVGLVEHRFSIGHRLWLGAKVWLASRSHLYTFLVQRIKALASRQLMSQVGVIEPGPPPVEGESKPLRITEQLILIARRDAHSLGARFMVLVIPERSQVLRPEGGPRSALDILEQHFVSWFGRETVLHTEALAALRIVQRRGERPFFATDGHLNALGHRVVAELLADRLAHVIQQTKDGAERAGTGEQAAAGRRLR
jgi:lysophospholipase L1-like esterase